MKRMTQAAALHRQAAATVAAAQAALDRHISAPPDPKEQYELAERLRVAAAALTPGWLGAPPCAAATGSCRGRRDDADLLLR